MRLTIDGNAWNRGFWDGELGLPLRLCPYAVGTTERWSWSSGYIEGNAARNGYAVIRPAPRQQEKLAPGAEADAVALRSTASASAPEETQEKGVKIARRSGRQSSPPIDIGPAKCLDCSADPSKLLQVPTRPTTGQPHW